MASKILPRDILIAVLVAFIWGMNFTAVKDVVSGMPVFFLLSLRLLIVFCLLLPFLEPLKCCFWRLYFIAITWGVFHFGLIFIGMDMGINVSVAAIVDQLRVPFATLLGFMFLSERFSKLQLLGVCVAIFGTLIVFGAPSVSDNYHGFGYIIASTIAWAFYNVQVKKMPEMQTLSFIGWMSLIAVPHLLIISFLFEKNQFDSLMQLNFRGGLSLIYISVAATIVAHGLWYSLLKKYEVKYIVPFSLLIPLFGVLGGIVLMGESVTWQIISGGVITVLGVAITIYKKNNSLEVSYENNK